MNTRKHIHEEEFPVDVETLFELLHTPSSICQWWQAKSAIVLPQAGGTWAVTWGESVDDPDYISIATIREFEPPRRLVFSDYKYFVKGGELPFDADFITEFLVSPVAKGSSSLRVTQDGFPENPVADEFYEGCKIGWTNTFAGIRDFIGETPG